MRTEYRKEHVVNANKRRYCNSRASSKVSLKDDACRRLPGKTVSVGTYCTSDSSCVGSDIGMYRQLEREYTYRMLAMYASANSCVDRLITEGGRDAASGLTWTADKRREGATPAETDEQ